MVFKDSIANLNSKEINDLYDKWYSFYPLLYRELILSKEKTYSFYDKNILRLFNELKYSENKDVSVKIFLSNLAKIFELDSKDKNKNKDIYSIKSLTEFLSTFYAWEKNSRKEVLEVRKEFIERAYKKSTIKDIYWRHDGWWNCYYGKLEDNEALDILSKQLKEKQPIYNKIKSTLTLAYRYSEVGRIKEGRKIVKKALRFLKIKIFLMYYLKKQQKPDYVEAPQNIISSKIFFFIYNLNSYYSDFSRYSLNLLMYLYRTEKHSRKKLHIINKILKENKFYKLFLKDTFTKFCGRVFYMPKMYIRPQHILRLIEVRTDKYSLKPDKKLINEIEYLIEQLMIYIRNDYYDFKEIIGYFIVTEIYLTIYYYLKVLKR
jgi:hypothetical protein